MNIVNAKSTYKKSKGTYVLVQESKKAHYLLG